MTIKVSDLIAPQMDSSDDTITFKSQWVITHWTNKESWDHMDSWWEFYRPGYKEKGKKPWNLLHYGLGGSATSDSCTFLRADPRNSWKIYPQGDWQIGRVNIWVRGSNKKDKPTKWWYSQDLIIWLPPKPEVEFNVDRASDGTVNDLTVSVKKGKYHLDWINAACDNYDTAVRIWKTSNTAPRTLIHGFQAYTTDEEINIDSSNIEQGLKYNEWVKIEVDAYSRGCAGDGEHAIESHIFAWPSTPQISNIAIDNANSIVLVGINTNQTAYHPVDTVKLQRLKDSECESSSAAALASGWSDVSGMSDTGNCKGLSDNLIDATPSKGKRTWYRVVAQHDGYTTYSSPVDLGIYQPSVEAHAGAAVIMNAISGDDGESVIADLAWNDDTFLNVTDKSEIDKYKGSTKITWADTEYAWNSTSKCNEFEIDWEDDAPRFEDYTHSARVYISDLTEGENVFIRVRRVLANGEDTVNGEWSEIVSVKPVTSPAWVELSAPSYIARGESLPLSWTFGSEAEQTGWSIVDSNGRLWGQGEDSNSFMVIDAEELTETTELTLYVNVTTGGEWKRSVGAVTVRIAEAPTCTIEAPETVTSLPIEITGTTNGSSIIYRLVSRGITIETPQGEHVQYANDIVWSGVGIAGDIEIDDADILNGCTYDLRAQSVSDTTGLYSEEVSCSFKVELSRRAPVPDASIQANASDMSATITTIKTAEMQEGDTYEIYRMTNDGVYLIASDIEPGSVVTDRFAPFSPEGNAYRIAVRTSDGDRAWLDFPYELKNDCIRLDWQDSFVELPYNISLSETMEKSFESRDHMDGAINGYWGNSVKHSSRFTTNMIRFSSDEAQALLRDMARYAGAVFVRTPSGLAFDANVDADEISEACSSSAIGVSLTVDEIDLTEAHSCRMGDIVAPSEGESDV